MNERRVLAQLRELSRPDAVAGMARFGISPSRNYGVPIPHLRQLAKEIGTDHALAERLWAKGVRETRILASMIDDPASVSQAQAERWVKDFADWEVCDQCCMNLLARTEWAYGKCAEWSARPEEFVKRAGFVLMARLAVSDKRAGDQAFEAMLPLIMREAGDHRNFVKKAVNWALRQIGKRNRRLNQKAVRAARSMRRMDSSSARWIAADALRELTSDAVRSRLR